MRERKSVTLGRGQLMRSRRRHANIRFDFVPLWEKSGYTADYSAADSLNGPGRLRGASSKGVTQSDLLTMVIEKFPGEHAIGLSQGPSSDNK